MNLQQNILNRLQAGTLVTIVVEADEAIAVAAARMAASAVVPNAKDITVLSILDGEFGDKLAQHKDNGKGVMIICDLLRVQGNNPALARLIREFALQVKQPPYPRIILIETPGVEIPAGLKGDVEYVYTKLPTVDELKQELEQFLADQAIKLEGNGEVRAAIANALAGLARHEAARLLARCWVENKNLDAKWLRKAKAERIQEQSGKALSFIDVENVPVLGGAEVMQDWLAIAQASFTSDKAKAYGLPEPKGILLVGVPGTGKSLTPKNIARNWGAPLVRLDVGAVFGSLVGQTEAQMRAVLQAVEACAPCILWIDEIEKALGGKSGSDGDSGVSTRLTGSLLTWLQENEKPIFVVATANSVENLRPELLRKGRIDEIFFVDLPDQEEREAIAKIHVLRKKRDINVLKPKDIADVCDNFSGAEIEQAILDAMKKAFSKGREFTMEDIAEAAAATTPLSKTMEKDITALRNWAKGKARYANRKAQAKAESATGVKRAGMNTSGDGFGDTSFTVK
jgi:hypothetical protein